MTAKIAVTGASGGLGSRVVRLLGERRVPQRLLVRDPQRASAPERAEIATASYEDPDALRAALSGISTLFFVSGHEAPNRMDLHRNVIQAAAEAGVDRVVYTSFMGAAPQATFTFARLHTDTERLITERGMRLTALRNALYADVAPHFVGPDAVLRGPAGQGRIAWVSRYDIARTAVEVLLDPAHANEVYDLSGPESIDLYETARLLSKVSGREITYHAETEQEARRSRAGAEEWQIDGWVGSYLAIATGETSVTSHSVEHITGFRPRRFEEFLLAEPDAWQHLVR